MRSTFRVALATACALLVLAPSFVVATHEPGIAAATEQLVEGHTVFTVVRATDYVGEAGASAPGASPAPSAAPSSHGHPPAPSSMVRRDPGVLWFNDQFVNEPMVQVEELGGEGSPLVESYFAAAVAALVKRTDAGGRTYLPCGGAVMLVNRGDPDPRAPGPLAADLGQPQVYTSFGYAESYLLTDPNGASWIVDRYDGYSRLDPASLGTVAAYEFPVFVVNVGGGPVFRPDLGEACAPVVDAPPALQPSINGYCYNGLMVDPMSSCRYYNGPQDAPHEPARIYNAFLWLPTDALSMAGAPRDHTLVTDFTMTNGCDQAWGWECPGYDDDAEGFSHPFRPTIPGMLVDPGCPEGFAAIVPANHGGSTYDMGVCDAIHATWQVDLFFDGASRPPEPLVRDFVILETGGEGAAYSSHR